MTTLSAADGCPTTRFSDADMQEADLRMKALFEKALDWQAAQLERLLGLV
jgi:uncharacterized protein involved in outer membrane biogenesis